MSSHADKGQLFGYDGQTMWIEQTLDADVARDIETMRRRDAIHNECREDGRPCELCGRRIDDHRGGTRCG